MTLLYFASIGVFATFLLWLIFGWKHDLDARLVASRKIPFAFIGTWMAVAFTWGTTYLYTASLAYSQGIVGWGTFAFGNTLGVVLPYWLAGRITSPEKLYSWPEAMGQWYGWWTVKSSAVFSMLVQVLYALSLQFIVVTLVLTKVIGVDADVAIASSASVMLIMMALGGIRSSFTLDMLKAGMMAALILYIAPHTIENAGGINSVIGGLSGVVGVPTTKESMSVFLLTSGVPIIVSLVTAGVMDQALYQRYFSAKPGPRRAVVFFMVVGASLFVLNMVASGALGALAANPLLGVEIAKGQEGIAGFIAIQKFAPEVANFFILTVVVSFFASGDTALNASTGVFIKEIIQPMWPKASDSVLRVVQVIAAAVFVLPAAYVAHVGTSMLFMVAIVGVFRSPFLFPTIYGALAKKVYAPNALGIIALAMVVGVGLFSTGKYCSLKDVACDLPVLSKEAYMFVGSLAGWVITGLYFTFMWLKNRRIIRITGESFLERG